MVRANWLRQCISWRPLLATLDSIELGCHAWNADNVKPTRKHGWGLRKGQSVIASDSVVDPRPKDVVKVKVG
jgi:hypothetical protein